MSETAENDRGKHQALSFNLPILIFLSKEQDLLGNVHNALWVVFCNTVQYVQGVDSHIGLRICQTDQSIVQEHIKPLLIEFLLLTNQVSLASIYNFIITDVILQVLHDLNAKIQVMLSVAVYQLTNVLPLVRALLNDVAVILEQMVYEKLIEVSSR